MTTAIAQFTKDLAPMQKQFASVLPSHIPAPKFMRTVVGAVQNNPSILECNKQSIYAACQKAAQDGLILDGREAALVKFGGACQYMPMVAGILKKLRNSGQLSTITAQTVHKADAFKYNPAMDDVPNHNPDWFGDRGEMIGAYAVARMKDGGVVVEVMNMQQINKVRAVSRASSKGPWVDWPEEMAKKTVLRRLAKMLPSSADIDQMFSHDNENYDLERDAATEPKQEGRTKAADAILSQSKSEPEAPHNDDIEDAEIVDDAPPVGDSSAEDDII